MRNNPNRNPRQNNRLIGKIATWAGIIAGSSMALFMLSHFYVSVTFAAHISLLKLLLIATLGNPFFLFTIGLSVATGIMATFDTVALIVTALDLYTKVSNYFSKTPAPRQQASAAVNQEARFEHTPAPSPNFVRRAVTSLRELFGRSAPAAPSHSETVVSAAPSEPTSEPTTGHQMYQ